MTNSIHAYIRTKIDSLYQTTAHVTENIASGLGSAYKATVSLFTHHPSTEIPAQPLDSTHLFVKRDAVSVSLHPKSEQVLREEYTNAFSQLLEIGKDSTPTLEKDIYSLILEVMENFKPSNLSPLAIIRFREVLNLQLNKLEAILVDRPNEKDKLQKKKKYEDRLKVTLRQLTTLRDVLKKGALTAPAVTYPGEDSVFTQQVTELALVIKIKAEKGRS